MADHPYDEFFETLGHRLDDLELLERAFTHRSWCAEHPGDRSNERLEFLGDAVLGLSVTESLYRNDPHQAEGQLAKARAEIVSTPVLARVARELGIGAHLRLGKGEELSGGRDKESILADAMEAVIAAAYLDGGRAVADRIIDRLLGDAVVHAQASPGDRDFKTRLQEVAMAEGLPAPVYRTSTRGPDHRLLFSAEVTVGAVRGEGTGSSKKQAERAAAEAALGQLQGAS